MTQINIRPAPGLWTARAAGAIIARSDEALEVVEGAGPPVIYFPSQDVAMALLEPAGDGALCGSRGLARLFHIVTPSGRVEAAGWAHDAPRQQMGAIAGRIAFVPGKVSLTCSDGVPA